MSINLLYRSTPSLQNGIANSRKLPVAIHRPSYGPRIDWAVTKMVARVPWIEVGVQVRQGVAVNFAIEFHSPCNFGQSLRNDLKIPYEIRRCRLREIVEFHGVGARHHTDVPAGGRTLLHREPRCAKRCNYIKGLPTQANWASLPTAESLPTIRVGPGGHGVTERYNVGNDRRPLGGRSPPLGRPCRLTC